MIKCKCGDPKCTTTISIDKSSDSVILVASRKEGDRTNEILLYLDPNSCVELVREISRSLKNLLSLGDKE